MILYLSLALENLKKWHPSLVSPINQIMAHETKLWFLLYTPLLAVRINEKKCFTENSLYSINKRFFQPFRVLQTFLIHIIIFVFVIAVNKRFLFIENVKQAKKGRTSCVFSERRVVHITTPHPVSTFDVPSYSGP